MTLLNYTSTRQFNFYQFSFWGSFVGLCLNKEFFTLKKLIPLSFPDLCQIQIANYLGWPTCKIKKKKKQGQINVFEDF